MKYRLGFVSNSSGSSFICCVYIPKFLVFKDLLVDSEYIIDKAINELTEIDINFKSKKEVVLKYAEVAFNDMKRVENLLSCENDDWNIRAACDLLVDLFKNHNLTIKETSMDVTCCSDNTTKFIIIDDNPMNKLSRTLFKKYLDKGDIKLEVPKLNFQFFYHKKFKNWDPEDYDWDLIEDLPIFCKEYKSIWGPDYIIKKLKK